MTNAFTSLIGTLVGARGGYMYSNVSKRHLQQSSMVALSIECLANVRGGDGVIESPKGSWSPASAETNA